MLLRNTGEGRCLKRQIIGIVDCSLFVVILPPSVWVWSPVVEIVWYFECRYFGARRARPPSRSRRLLCYRLFVVDCLTNVEGWNAGDIGRGAWRREWCIL